MMSLTPAERAMVKAKLARWTANPKEPSYRREALRTLNILLMRRMEGMAA